MTYNKAALLILIIALITVVNVSDAWAYIDPGTGSYLIQILIATALGAIFSLKIFWTRISAFFRKLLNQRKSNKG